MTPDLDDDEDDVAEMSLCERCERCGGEGLLEYIDAPDTWGEDCPSEVNHLIECPDCAGTGRWRPSA